MGLESPRAEQQESSGRIPGLKQSKLRLEPSNSSRYSWGSPGFPSPSGQGGQGEALGKSSTLSEGALEELGGLVPGWWLLLALLLWEQWEEDAHRWKEMERCFRDCSTKSFSSGW